MIAAMKAVFGRKDLKFVEKERQVDGKKNTALVYVHAIPKITLEQSYTIRQACVFGDYSNFLQNCLSFKCDRELFQGLKSFAESNRCCVSVSTVIERPKFMHASSLDLLRIVYVEDNAKNDKANREQAETGEKGRIIVKFTMPFNQTSDGSERSANDIFERNRSSLKQLLGVEILDNAYSQGYEMTEKWDDYSKYVYNQQPQVRIKLAYFPGFKVNMPSNKAFAKWLRAALMNLEERGAIKLSKGEEKTATSSDYESENPEKIAFIVIDDVKLQESIRSSSVAAFFLKAITGNDFLVTRANSLTSQYYAISAKKLGSHQRELCETGMTLSHARPSSCKGKFRKSKYLTLAQSDGILKAASKRKSGEVQFLRLPKKFKAISKFEDNELQYVIFEQCASDLEKNAILKFKLKLQNFTALLEYLTLLLNAEIKKDVTRELDFTYSLTSAQIVRICEGIDSVEKNFDDKLKAEAKAVKKKIQEDRCVGLMDLQKICSIARVSADACCKKLMVLLDLPAEIEIGKVIQSPFKQVLYFSQNEGYTFDAVKDGNTYPIFTEIPTYTINFSALPESSRFLAKARYKALCNRGLLANVELNEQGLTSESLNSFDYISSSSSSSGSISPGSSSSSGSTSPGSSSSGSTSPSSEHGGNNSSSNTKRYSFFASQTIKFSSDLAASKEDKVDVKILRQVTFMALEPRDILDAKHSNPSSSNNGCN